MFHSRISQYVVVVLTMFVLFSIFAGDAAACKVLAVISFSEEFFWSQEIKQGVEEELGQECEFKYIYLDGRENPDGVKAKADEAYALYQEWQPDGVIAEGDDAQTSFVMPYLKDKVQTPIMFAEVFGDPKNYGYPASNVSGVPSRSYFKESLAFVRQFDPTIQKIAIVVQDMEITRQAGPFIKQIFENDGMTVPLLLLSNDQDEILSNVEQIRSEVDAMFTVPALGEETVSKIVKTFGKPTFTGWGEGIRFGVLCGVTESGVEVGKLAAEMLQKAMNGVPVSEIPISTVEYGTRMVNVNTMKDLGIKPSRRVLTGVELIK